MCESAIQKWRKDGPKALNDVGWDVDGSIMKPDKNPEHTSGLWLFQDRNTITHFFAPNFLPPYNTIEKRELIWKFISQEWDEKELVFKPAGSRIIDKIEGEMQVDSCFTMMKEGLLQNLAEMTKR